ncbi:hypothetical protein MBRA1_002209 [Malassezia brasiliensis]|uniref:DNA replication checkpoint mediator MRC1 domain-containing protein n=1 Tax=Malassezia brasiliensis TaxID=1821822 RepID=A0AAF0DXU9_9BASI|nr:hypothetical protein MBRA1_002209 [Malassezia brasiliensis]
MAGIVAPPLRVGRTPAPERDERSTPSPSSSPSFQMGSSPRMRGASASHADTSYDTSLASVPEKRATRPPTPELETDLEESEGEAPQPPRTSMAARMRARDESAQEPLFLDESDDEVDARRSRMDRLRDLARQRAAQHAADDDDEAPAPAARGSSPLASKSPSPLRVSPKKSALLNDTSSESEMDVPSARPRTKGLSRKEQREMHSMSARLRREHRATIARPEPKRYQLSELLSTIQHAESRPEAHSSSDPVESSSTAARSTPEPAPRPVPSVPIDPNQERIQRKWAMLRAHQSSVPDDADSDVEVVALASQPKQQRAKKVLFRAPPKDTDRAEADHQLMQLGAGPRTPRARRISSDVYRSPNAHTPAAPPVTDREMNAAAHAFALAAHKVAGTLPPTSPSRADEKQAVLHDTVKQVPLVMDLAQLNETLLQKAYEQNARLAAKRSKRAPAELDLPTAAAPAAPADGPKTYGGRVRRASSTSDDDSDWSEGHGTASSAASDASASPRGASPASRRSASTHSAHNSEKENVPLSPMLPAADDNELDVDLGRFFAPTQVPSRVSPSPAPLRPSAGWEEPSARTNSNSSVLAQFFESTQDGPARGASLDLFANQKRDGPVGGMTQFFEPTPSASSSTRPTRSQEAMPPPTHAAASDGFAALRRQQREDARALLSPEMLPSLDPSLAERGEEWRERRTVSAANEVMYINQDGFFTQTKPAEDTPSQAPHVLDPSPSQRRTEPVPEFDGSPRRPSEGPAPEGSEAAPPSSQRHTSAPLYSSDPSDEESDAAPSEAPSDADASDAEADLAVASDARAHWTALLDQPSKRAKSRRERSEFVFGEAEESDEDRPDDGEHGGLTGVFSDRGSASEPEEDSDDDADLESLLDDERDENEEEQDEAARLRYQQHRDEDDAAIQALHERAAKGMLRNRRRRLDDPLADMLDEDADEDELRRKLHAPAFKAKRRRIEQDGLQALAEREDSRAFVETYNETHATEEAERYDFLGEASSDDEARVTTHDLRAELRRRAQARDEESEHAPSSDDETDAVLTKLRSRRTVTAPRTYEEEETEFTRLLFKTGQVDVASLPRELQERRARLLEEYSHEPHWRQERGGRHGIDRRRMGKTKRNTAPSAAPVVMPETRSAPSVLVHSILRRDAHFADAAP